MRERINVRKAVTYSIVLNAVQIIAVLLLLLYLMTRNVSTQNRGEFILLMAVLGALVCWGAVMDIHEARSAVQLQRQAEALEKTYEHLENLNQTLRAQRHDFMNHLQVVYSLIEMQESAEALDYIERVHGDLQRVGRTMRTASPAVNALLQAKVADCERRGIEVRLSITSRWEFLPMPGWEMCRVLGNLIDNAIEILQQCKDPCLRIVLYKDVKTYRFRVENNGDAIPEALLAHIFAAGFTTKEEGHGMGLSIVREVLRQHGGEIAVQSAPGSTAFEGHVPKAAEGAEEDA